ncbi:polysaccharide biosynthesis protein [Aureimonas phyllosphaerae]|uniref:polysaccharide biosynthesis protein n=1 Tax=Aureimonas phyllosphaerae TaxID=1166078 RepID=UPI003A5C16A9
MASPIELQRPGGGALGLHAIPLYAASIARNLLNGPASSPWPSFVSRNELYHHLRQRTAKRLKATRSNLGLYAGDLALAAVAFLLASAVRLGLEGQATSPDSFRALSYALPLFVATCALIFPMTCLYRRNWRYASVADLLDIVRAVAIASLGFVICLFLTTRFDAVPRSVVVMQALLLTFLLVGARMRFKIAEIRRFEPGTGVATKSGRDIVPVLLVGAGDIADLYLRALQRDGTARHWPVGILDRATGTAGNLLRGVPILGTIADFDEAMGDLEVRGLKPRHLIFTETISSFTDPEMKALIDRADRLGIAISRPAPALELRNPNAGNRLELRPIELTDLLERSQTTLDRDALHRLIHGCRVVVTGAGGSIGRELTLQVAGLGPAEIVLIESCEFNLYAIDLELSEKHGSTPRKAYLCNVRDAGRLNEIFARHKPDLVFHAAALKHVPMVEMNPCEGILTNVIGSMNVAEATRACGARAMVQISTDKVVNATSVMGATKRLAELYCQALDLAGERSDERTRFMTVRFGNVLGSSGSLIPLFERQLARGGPLTVTHPDMKRFFMTIREAVELTLQASAYGLEKRLGLGEIFVLDMGEPIKIIDMARRMIKLAGYRPGEDIKIDFVGCRPGEKLFEELFDADEERVASPVPGVFGAVPHPVPLQELRQAFEGLEKLAQTGDAHSVIGFVARVLPSYQNPLHQDLANAEPAPLACAAG